MIETLIVVVLLGTMLAFGFIATVLSPESILMFGLGLVAVGVVVGFPAGFYYHLLLLRGLRESGGAPPGWYWDPIRHHGQVSDAVRVRMRPWFRIGAGGFVLIIAGCLVTGLFVMIS